jgi:hypothetical protein
MASISSSEKEKNRADPRAGAMAVRAHSGAKVKVSCFHPIRGGRSQGSQSRFRVVCAHSNVPSFTSFRITRLESWRRRATSRSVILITGKTSRRHNRHLLLPGRANFQKNKRAESSSAWLELDGGSWQIGRMLRTKTNLSNNIAVSASRAA